VRTGTPSRILAAALLGAAACRRAPPPTNLLLVTLDTTRGDHLGCYGYASAHTPNLDALARSGIQFDEAITAAPLTLPSHTSILTGTYPVFHGVRDNDGYVVDDGLNTLAETLKPRGFTTAAFVASYPLSSQFNLRQGFDTYDDDFRADWTAEQQEQRTPLSFGFVERKSDQVNAAVSRWLEGHARDRFFLWVHYFDPHQPYDPPAPYDVQFAGSPYDGEIAFMDESFGKLLGMLEARGLRDRTLVLVVGDHGEGLEQHGELTHASFLYDTTIHVPLLLSVPGGRFAPGLRIKPQVRTIDILPTLLDLLGIETPRDVQGTSLLPLVRDPRREWRHEALVDSRFNELHYGWAPLRALRDGRYKYVEAPTPELYDLQADPGETRNLAASDPSRAQDMRSGLARLADAMSATDLGRSAASHLAPEARAALQALGYVGGGNMAALGARFPSPEALARMPNPADKGLILKAVNITQERMRKRRFDECVSLARGGLQMDPGNFRLRMSLAQCQALLGLGDRALEELHRAAALRPDDAEPYALEGRILVWKGRYAEAIPPLQKAVRLAPRLVETLRVLAAACALAGRDPEAIQRYEAALRLDETSWSAHLDLGGAYSRVGRLEDARRAYQRALDLNPYSTTVLIQVGEFYARLGDADFARRSFEGALRIAPLDPGAHLALGKWLLQRGGNEAAQGREHLRRAIELAPASAAARRAALLLADADPRASP
jgi:arylsulfatase A-like enzyme/Flp pilus assembly protein TadD